MEFHYGFSMSVCNEDMNHRRFAEVLLDIQSFADCTIIIIFESSFHLSKFRLANYSGEISYSASLRCMYTSVKERTPIGSSSDKLS